MIVISSYKHHYSNRYSYNEILDFIKFEDNSIKKNNIYNENCITFINKMIKENIKVDAIITDPPYNISRKNNFKTIGRNGIDFGEWDKKFNQTSWLENINEILNDGGSIIIFNDWKNIGEIAKFLEEKGFIVKDLIRWIKPNPMPRNVERRYVTDFELALWVVKKGKKWIFNKDKNIPYKKPEYIHSAPMGKNRIHPTQKSSEIILDIIKTHTKEGDLIFDPFSGSGAISYCASKINRDFIACEIEKTYYESSLIKFKKEEIYPAFNHIGNKRRIIKDIITSFPTKQIVNFVDVFAGSGVVTANYKNAKKYFINDNDVNVTKLLEYLFNNNKDIVINEIKGIIKNYNLPTDNFYEYKNEFNKLRSDYNFKKKEIYYNHSALLLVLVLFGFNQQIRFNSNNEFNIPVGKFYFNQYQELKISKFISSIEKANVSIENQDFKLFVLETLEKINTRDSLFYFDPPYLITNGTYNILWNEEEEIKLLEVLNLLTSKKIKWVLSNQLFSNKKTNTILLDFLIMNKTLKVTKLDINYSNSNYQRKTNDKDLEIIVRNF